MQISEAARVEIMKLAEGGCMLYNKKDEALKEFIERYHRLLEEFWHGQQWPNGEADPADEPF